MEHDADRSWGFHHQRDHFAELCPVQSDSLAVSEPIDVDGNLDKSWYVEAGGARFAGQHAESELDETTTGRRSAAVPRGREDRLHQWAEVVLKAPPTLGNVTALEPCCPRGPELVFSSCRLVADVGESVLVDRNSRCRGIDARLQGSGQFIAQSARDHGKIEWQRMLREKIEQCP
jgi:hypothetical protein